MSDTKKKENARLVIPRCVITKIYHAESSGKDYLTIEDGENTFNIGSGDLDLSGVETLVPVRLEAEIGAFMFKGKLALTFKSFDAVPVA